MDQGPDPKRPRLSTGPSWPPSHGMSLPTPYQSSHPPYPPRSSDPPPPAQPHDDRRHEPDHFPGPPSSLPPLLPDPHRPPPPPSPAHPPPYSTYPPRDPLVKRDPSADDPLRRSHSTGVPESMSNHPHGLPPHSQPPDHAPPRQMSISYDNGPPPPQHSQIGPSTPVFRPPGPPGPQHPTASYPSTPMAIPHPSAYDHPPYGHPVHDQAYQIPVTMASNSKRKAQRASQACDSCRQLKAKCDESKPCKSCKEKGVECKYRDPAPKAQDKVATDTLEGIKYISAMIEHIVKRLDAQDTRQTRFEEALKTHFPSLNLSSIPIKSSGSPETMDVPEAVMMRPPDEMASFAMDTADHETQGTTMNPEQAHEILIDEDAVMDEEPGAPIPPGAPAIPINHTTPAAMLLQWEPIKVMVDDLLKKEGIKYPGDYPLRQEHQRGLLRIYGRGEGRDVQDAPVTDRDNRHMNLDHVTEDDASEIGLSPAPADHHEYSCWGQVGGLTPPNGVAVTGMAVGPDGNPDYDEKTVWKYVRSFQDNILNMHPIITVPELEALATLFLTSLPPGPPHQARTEERPALAQFLESPRIPSVETLPVKRKWSPTPDFVPEPRYVPSSKPGKPYRTLRNAVVLIILALGKISLHKGKIPDLVPAHESSPHANSPALKNGYPPSPIQRSPPPPHSGLPSPRDIDKGQLSRRPSFQGTIAAPRAVPSLKHNYDVVPGLEYFALATDILGNQHGGASLHHVWAHVLAGLYFGQLARVHESWTHIATASRTLLVILGPKMSRMLEYRRLFQAKGTPPQLTKRENQLIWAYWTCLQLESDILAELHLPPSTLLHHEASMPWPNVYEESAGVDKRIQEGYLAQLYVRNHLNKIHSELYDPSKPLAQTDYQKTSDVNAEFHQRLWLPESYSFMNGDEPATDILDARLRAKYWGAIVITFRPYVRKILDYNIQNKSGMALAERDLFAEPQFQDNVQLALLGLVESTRSFHGVCDENTRVIVTNVFGTAHAQWGNLLILAACYRDPTLKNLINAQQLKELFRRTVQFLILNAHTPSSALASDARILKGVGKAVLEMTEDDFSSKISGNATGSFSSSGSHHPVLQPAVGTPAAVHTPVVPVDSGVSASTPTVTAPPPFRS